MMILKLRHFLRELWHLNTKKDFINFMQHINALITFIVIRTSIRIGGVKHAT